MPPDAPQIYDLFVIGGGVNGCGIARDAAGRGLRVGLAEQGDLASATSSASSKLFHGGLRYLEYFEFRLVRESLAEREVLLRAMPHISWPMRFVLPLSPEMRFPTDTPAARMLGRWMPWLRGRRPGWMIRLGLFLYDHLGGRQILPGTRAVDLRHDPAGVGLHPSYRRAFEYSDCWVDDARLVVLNARDAAERGADIATRTRVVAAQRRGGLWRITLEGGAEVQARHLVNAAGPWVDRVVRDAMGQTAPRSIRLVRGSHIVTRRLFDHDRAYFLQGPDGRIIFLLPFQGDFTLIGTTDAAHDSPDTPPVCTEAERDYLIAFANRYLRHPIGPEDVIHSFAGVRSLVDDGAASDTAATRDYVLKPLGDGGFSVLGGKITSYRKLSEAAVTRLFPGTAPWTSDTPLPGGDFGVDQVDAQVKALHADYPFLTPQWTRRLIRAYGTSARDWLGPARAAADLGHDFGATLTEAEVRWMMTREFARRADDVVWRRSKLGLRMGADQIAALDEWMQAEAQGGPR
ncbi:glycerol-3-phosphate dehydrogenase [Actibacterium sp. XHP0104]|uniref:glycerol-3-phosphate dehydrogenase n=1 Tax=Actibacterium sp. XHP0104 TaxID=2984335 RepID=UPI0021E71D5C|nr:glycerol-3-phosphate dehydrogenase [Actibacterium sp. XHP0104]MCV2881690.1 glycerol-3-phosphate dehydrogenase [Actibacterium sp. XHP0104]